MIDLRRYEHTSAVCRRFGIGRSTLDRWCADPALGFPKPLNIRKRRYFRTAELDAFEEKVTAPEPPPVVAGPVPLSGPITDYEVLVSALRGRRMELGMSLIELDARSGLQEGYASKLEAGGRPECNGHWARGMGKTSMPLWLGALGVALVLVDMKAAEPKHG